MKLSVSNIAWDNERLEEHLALLRDLGCDGIEIAPSCIWKEPSAATTEEVGHFKKTVLKYGLEIPAFHALLFTRPDLYIFADESVRTQTIIYLKGLMRLAQSLSARFLIYGSPRSRKVGDKDRNKCYGIAVDFFRKLAKEAHTYDVCLCIEPLGRSESDFITTADEGYSLVRDVNDPHFGLHLDAKAMAEAKEDFEKVFKRYGKTIRHFHVGDPNLAPPGCAGLDHSPIGKALISSPYKGYVSIEMRKGFGDSKEVIEKAVRYVREKYGIPEGKI